MGFSLNVGNQLPVKWRYIPEKRILQKVNFHNACGKLYSEVLRENGVSVVPNENFSASQPFQEAEINGRFGDRHFIPSQNSDIRFKLNNLRRLSARENFVEFYRRESFKLRTFLILLVYSMELSGLPHASISVDSLKCDGMW